MLPDNIAEEKDDQTESPTPLTDTLTGIVSTEGKFFIDRHDTEFLFAFSGFLERSGFDMYGHVANEELEPFRNPELHCFENGTFVLRPYYWGDEEGINNLPNFVYKPDGYEIHWYKYPMRAAYANREIDAFRFRGILAECERSLDSVYGGPFRKVARPRTMSEVREAIGLERREK